MKSKIFTFILLMAAFSLTNAQVTEFLKIPDGHDPVIDGVVDDNDPWQEEWLSMEQIVDTDHTTDDMECKFQMLHNGSMIFVVLDIIDATPNNEGIENSYQEDNIEIFFYMGPAENMETANASYVDGETVQARFVRDGDQSLFNGALSDDDGFDGTGTPVLEALLNDESFEWKIVSDGDGYVFEGAFPISALDINDEFDGTNLAFDIKVADNSDGSGTRSQQNYYYNNDDNKYRYIDIFTPITLSETEVAVNQIGIENLGAENAYVFVAEGALSFRNVKGNVSIYSITGTLVKEDVVESNSAIDISSLNSGIYFVKTENLTIKFVK